MVAEPFHQWHVIRHTAKQGHGGMGVGIDEARQQRVVRQLHFLAAQKALVAKVPCQQRYDSTPIYDDRVISSRAGVGFYRDDPARVYDEINALRHGRKIQFTWDQYKRLRGSNTGANLLYLRPNPRQPLANDDDQRKQGASDNMDPR
jgi:hypothetical protein